VKLEFSMHYAICSDYYYSWQITMLTYPSVAKISLTLFALE